MMIKCLYYRRHFCDYFFNICSCLMFICYTCRPKKHFNILWMCLSIHLSHKVSMKYNRNTVSPKHLNIKHHMGHWPEEQKVYLFVFCILVVKAFYQTQSLCEDWMIHFLSDTCFLNHAWVNEELRHRTWRARACQVTF